MNRPQGYQHGAVSGSLVAIILLSFGMVVLAGGAIWLYTQYADAKSNLDSKVEAAVAEGRRDQQKQDQEDFLEKEKEPNKLFAGPDDFGRLTFSYPKTWSVYVEDDGSESGEFKSFLHPSTVPPTDIETSRFALRVRISGDKYQEVVADYTSLAEDGELKSRAVSANGQSGTRFDGKFDENIRGSVVVFKLRDKTLQVFSDADTFKTDFEKLIKTIQFNT